MSDFSIGDIGSVSQIANNVATNGDFSVSVPSSLTASAASISLANETLSFNPATMDDLKAGRFQFLSGGLTPNQVLNKALSDRATASAYANGYVPNGSAGKQAANLTDSDARLYMASSRAARTLYNNKGKDIYTSDRGPITTMKLLPGPGYDPSKPSGLNATTGTGKFNADVEALKAGRFANFFLTNVSMNFGEKVQITQTFGDNEVVYYFGRQPMVLNMSGLLFDSLENDWLYRFLTLHQGVLRGTQLAKSFSLVEITFPNMVVTGTISELGIGQDAHRDVDIPFSMQFIAKSVLPLPAVMPTGTATQNNVGSLIDFKANRKGVQGYTLGSGGLGGGFMDTITSSVGSVGSALGGLSSAAKSVSDTLNSFRTSIFTPVFGIIASITKIVKSTTGTITSIISSFTNPVNQVLRDITNIATQASGIALMVENSINQAIQIPARTLINARNTLRSIKSSAGTISRVPENISETFKRLYGSGRIKRGAAVLSSGKARTKSKAAILTSGSPYQPTTSNKL